MSRASAILAAVGFLAIACDGAAAAKVRCTRDYAPVCARAADGVRSFNNRNCARAERARILHEGVCRTDVERILLDEGGGAHFCAMIDEPVCAERGGVRLTFPNLCVAGVAGAALVHRGRCEALWPVIGNDVLEPREEDPSKH